MSNRTTENGLATVLAILLLAVVCGWWFDHYRLQRKLDDLQDAFTRAQDLMDRREALDEDMEQFHVQVLTVVEPNDYPEVPDDAKPSGSKAPLTTDD